MHPVHFEQQYHSFHTAGVGAAPGGSGTLASTHMISAAGAEPEVNPYKRQKTTAERKAEKEAKAARLAAQQQNFDPEAPFTLGERQPWAEKAREVSQAILHSCYAVLCVWQQQTCMLAASCCCVSKRGVWCMSSVSRAHRHVSLGVI